VLLRGKRGDNFSFSFQAFLILGILGPSTFLLKKWECEVRIE
jgi:hypothetical protein